MTSLAPLTDNAHALAQHSQAWSQHALASVDEIIARLETARAHLVGSPSGGQHDDGAFADTLLPLSSFVKTANTTSQSKGKEWGSAVSRLAKDVDKRFGAPPPPLFPPAPISPPPQAALHPSLARLLPPSSSSSPSNVPLTTAPFSSPTSLSALHAAIASHLARLGAFSALSSFLAESGTPAPPGLEEGGAVLQQLRELHGIVEEVRAGNVDRAIAWLEEHPEVDKDGALEYGLRKEQFIAMVLSASASGTKGGLESSTADVAMDTDDASSATSVASAIAYGGHHFRRLMTSQRSEEICALLTSPLYLPPPRLFSSPYGSLFSSYTSTSPSSLPSTSASPSATPPPTEALANAFTTAYLATLGLPRDSPLAVVTDVGGSGALAKIMKVRQVMKDKKTEWTAVGELPVEIPLPLRYRYHSVFACPVSKEQSTANNPPMLMPCGHVIAKESLGRLARGTPTLKCPYCPVVSHFSACVRVHF
ncbi:hypothetical protein JCM8547_005826 [Rhodosporidiobolus lusitaniae]